MKKFTFNAKTIFFILPLLFLMNSPALSHTTKSSEFGMSHAFLSSEHNIPLVFIGILVGILMITQKRSLIVAGNLGLVGFLAFLVFSHSLKHNFLFGLEFLMMGGLISLASWRATYWVFRITRAQRKNIEPMLHKNFSYFDKLIKFEKVQAHCDIPCKIYDPSASIIAALSVIRLIDIMNETHSMEDKPSVDYQNTMTRCIQRKEEESEKLKHEIRIIWGDYFKAPQFDAFPEAHNTVHQIMLLASATKQGADRKKAEELLELTNQFAEIFWATKEVETERKIAPYPPSLSVVRPK
jgi:nickel superoxide dismutase